MGEKTCVMARVFLRGEACSRLSFEMCHAVMTFTAALPYGGRVACCRMPAWPVVAAFISMR